MNIFHALLLGIVEGLTEFLPISSTGHMTLTSSLLQLQNTEFLKNFLIIIQLGAILAVVVYYWNTISKDVEIWKKVLTAFVPTAIVGYILFAFIKHYLLGNEAVTLWSLLIGGIIIIVFELLYKEKDQHVGTIERISYKNAFIIGVIQSLAVIPGVSRSAATIISALALGTKRKTAVEFSFLLAVPTIAAATGLDVLKAHFSFTSGEIGMLLVGFVAAFVVAYVTIKFFLQFIRKNTFIPFGVYRIVIAILFWLVVLHR